jgi:hypothetical protein
MGGAQENHAQNAQQQSMGQGRLGAGCMAAVTCGALGRQCRGMDRLFKLAMGPDDGGWVCWDFPTL